MWRPSSPLVVMLAMAGCASGGAKDVPDANGETVDSLRVDTVLIDAPAQQTLSQTTSNTIKPVASKACLAASGTAPNNYYRVFDLATFGITSEFHVSQVSFQVEHCEDFDSTTGCNVVVRVGTYSGTVGNALVLANMSVLATANNVAVPQIIEDLGPPATTPGGTVNVPITATAPAGSKLFIEVDVPDGNGQFEFYMGANDGGETGFGYVLAPSPCNITAPTNISSVGSASPVHLLMTVSGSY